MVELTQPKKGGKIKVVTTTTKKENKPPKNALFVKRVRNYRIGNDIQPQRDLGRYVKWPKYIQIQRQKKILLQRMKIPPPINQFSYTLDASVAKNLFKILAKYAPETEKQKEERLKKKAELAEMKDKPESKQKNFVKIGLNHITHLIEEKKAKLVIIAHDVDPIELVLFLPTLCRKLDIPYCFVKGKK